MSRLTLCLCGLLNCFFLSAQPISLHPENPHYLAYQGSPILLISSAEHYGAVLNQDFDYHAYLQTLEAAGMNYTRIFSGSYVELPESFGIGNNTLSPAVGSYLTPWQRVEAPGLYEGEGKFDFDQWNPAYFARLKDFIREAAERGIIVELTFFCATYQDATWERHPFNPHNNVNYDDSLARLDFNTRRHPQTFAYQKALVRKLATELNEFDNLFYELSNEPWSDGNVDERFLLKTLRPQGQNLNWALLVESPTPERMAWQRELAATLAETEQTLPKQHLIAQNFTNFAHALPEVDPNISLLNFHYAWPEAVPMNYGWDRPVSFDESGFAGQADTTYLHQGWAFLLAGGAVFNHLDYSFAVGQETGTDTSSAPGGGSPRLRSQLAFLQEFMGRFDYIEMRPAQEILYHTPGMTGQAIAETGEQYAIYLAGKAPKSIRLRLSPGTYRYQVVSPDTGKTLSEGELICEEELAELPLTTEVGYRIGIGVWRK